MICSSKSMEWFLYDNGLRLERVTYSAWKKDIEFFKNIFLIVLNKHAPIKTKYSRANHPPFVTKELSKAIMLRSNLWNQYLKCKSEGARTRFKVQRNLCVTLLRKAKHDYYENLELGKVNESKKFWNTEDRFSETK